MHHGKIGADRTCSDLPNVADFASCPIASAVDGPFSWRRPEELGHGNILSVQPGDYSF
jgi:hypothetical protein